MMSMWKWVGLGIGLILLGGLFESGFAANMMVAVSMTVFLLLFAAGPVAGSVSRRPGWKCRRTCPRKDSLSESNHCFIERIGQSAM